MISEQQDVRKQSGQTVGDCLDSRKISQRTPSAYLPHQQPATLKLIQFELDRSHLLCRMGVGSLDRPEHFTLAAHQHNAEAAFHPAGELGRGVFGFGAAGWHGRLKLVAENREVESAKMSYV